MENRSFDHVLGWLKSSWPNIDNESNPLFVSSPSSPTIPLTDINDPTSTPILATPSWPSMSKSSDPTTPFHALFHMREFRREEMKRHSKVARMLKDLSLRCQEVHTISAVMKGDDDTFVRVDAVIDEARKVPDGGDAIASIYETTWDIVDPRAMDQIK
ncbi:Non-specific phospholipase C1 [Glycine soja]